MKINIKREEKAHLHSGVAVIIIIILLCTDAICGWDYHKLFTRSAHIANGRGFDH